MRPLYAIAPLALLMALFGPTPHEANKVLANFKDHFVGVSKNFQNTEPDGETTAGSSSAQNSNALNNRGAAPSAETVMPASFKR